MCYPCSVVYQWKLIATRNHNNTRLDENTCHSLHHLGSRWPHPSTVWTTRCGLTTQRGSHDLQLRSKVLVEPLLLGRFAFNQGKLDMVLVLGPTQPGIYESFRVSKSDCPFSVSDLLKKCNRGLFYRMSDNNHALHISLLPKYKESPVLVRHRSCILPRVNTERFKDSFFIRLALRYNLGVWISLQFIWLDIKSLTWYPTISWTVCKISTLLLALEANIITEIQRNVKLVL